MNNVQGEEQLLEKSRTLKQLSRGLCPARQERRPQSRDDALPARVAPDLHKVNTLHSTFPISASCILPYQHFTHLTLPMASFIFTR